MAELKKAIDISIELNTVWIFSGIGKKEKFQKLPFPEGIVYDRSKGEFRTDRVNSVFELIAELVRDIEGTNKGQTVVKDRLSLSAGRRGQVSNFFVEDIQAIAIYIHADETWAGICCNQTRTILIYKSSWQFKYNEKGAEKLSSPLPGGSAAGGVNSQDA